MDDGDMGRVTGEPRVDFLEDHEGDLERGTRIAREDVVHDLVVEEL
jgi:hypothetical protein